MKIAETAKATIEVGVRPELRACNALHEPLVARCSVMVRKSPAFVEYLTCRRHHSGNTAKSSSIFKRNRSV
jgi:hypothetical protein